MMKKIIQHIELYNEDLICINGVTLKRIKQIGQGKSGKVYLYEGEGISYAVKHYQYETFDPMIVSIPLEEVLDFELKCYRLLSDLGISVAPLIGFDTEKQILVKTFIKGENMMDQIAENKVTPPMFECIFNLSSAIKSAGYNLDYFPANFIFDGSKIWYVDYEINPFEQEWSFEDWGIYYWLNPKGVKRFLETRNGDFINKPGTVKPYDNEEIQLMRTELLHKYKT